MEGVLVFNQSTGEWEHEDEFETWDDQDYCYECRGLGDDSYFVWNELAQDYDMIDNCADCPFNPLRYID